MNEFFTSIVPQIDLQFVVQFVIIYLFIIWIAVIIWVVKDISIRTNNVFFQIFSVSLVFVGTPLAVFLYLIIRPGKTLYEKYYDEIEDNLEIIAELLEERRLEKEDENNQNHEEQVEKYDKKPKERRQKLLAKSETTQLKKKTTLKKKKF